MRVQAVKAFCGNVCMRMGEIRDITDPSILADLLHANLVKAVEEEQKKEQKKTTKRK